MSNVNLSDFSSWYTRLNAYGSYLQGINSNGTLTNETNSDGCTETTNTRETTYTNI